jgi:hypothetical protein
VPAGIDPTLLLWALSGCESSFGKNLNGNYAATNLEQFADSYNSGTWRDQNVPTIYIKRFKQFYGMGLPSSEVK